MNNITDLIISLAVAAIPVIGTFALNFFKANKEVATFLAVLEPLAKDAVVAAQKLGVNSYISGELKKSNAVSSVLSALEKLGFDNVDQTTVKNAVEDEYSKIIDELDKIYPQQSLADYQAEQAKAKAETDAKAKADALAAAQADLKNAQAKVAELSK